LGRRDKSGERGAEEKKLLPKVGTKCSFLYVSGYGYSGFRIHEIWIRIQDFENPDPGFLPDPDPGAGFYSRLNVKKYTAEKIQSS
jgi:hypothetical protein